LYRSSAEQCFGKCQRRNQSAPKYFLLYLLSCTLRRRRWGELKVEEGVFVPSDFYQLGTITESGPFKRQPGLEFSNHMRYGTFTLHKAGMQPGSMTSVSWPDDTTEYGTIRSYKLCMLHICDDTTTASVSQGQRPTVNRPAEADQRKSHSRSVSGRPCGLLRDWVWW
jgi:hypothetical protein